MENIISVSHLSFGYDSKRKVLENINFQLKKGESVGLVGANGVGKSTLLRILVGLNTGFQGDVMVNNIPLERLLEKMLATFFRMRTVSFLCQLFLMMLLLHREITECLRQKLMRKQWKR